MIEERDEWLNGVASTPLRQLGLDSLLECS
jgi:hypothetical protein